MALINCPECSKAISDQSISCPSCGFPTPSEQIDNNDLLASSRQRQKNSGCSGATIFLIIIIVLIGFWLVSAYDGYTEKARQYSEEQSEPDKESPQVQGSLFDSPLTQIPMLLSGSGEDGRYFLISHFASYGIENVKYARRGKESDSFGEMQIDCTNGKIRKTSSDNLEALTSADLGDWYTPTPDWTDQDIVNFICPIESVVSKNIEHHEVVEKVVTLEAPKNEVIEKVTLEQFKPEPVISAQAIPREVVLSNAPSGSEKEYKVWEPPIKTKEPYNEKVVNKAADDKKERDIARRKSDDRAICEQAIKVNSAYLGKDDPEYSQWKAIERANCMQDKLYE
ncbi:zinc ribbon domain-containing protein [Psychrobacter cryohalolentis]|uniref:Zinc-ribbon domain-containing protein n=1 Tax=Psychrobacter cryohalolentis (strain ATCC BAA-1226 / DSM 17306 / VKM B-2378 / K5) TaxID=335284 RepID=Q1Q9B5_PSYCK|nr:zinc ribbon domain-containing protein [Psychrobacter cryohalolentis]ABE75738.1 hypothetical protein Pcryo_1961 [Psychrobacter cryohalolentis K5]ASE25928.1 zinc ribbon domain-containing protein [Psychrobacter cryohalolentis]